MKIISHEQKKQVCMKYVHSMSFALWFSTLQWISGIKYLLQLQNLITCLVIYICFILLWWSVKTDKKFSFQCLRLVFSLYPSKIFSNSNYIHTISQKTQERCTRYHIQHVRKKWLSILEWKWTDGILLIYNNCQHITLHFSSRIIIFPTSIFVAALKFYSALFYSTWFSLAIDFAFNSNSEPFVLSTIPI